MKCVKTSLRQTLPLSIEAHESVERTVCRKFRTATNLLFGVRLDHFDQSLGIGEVDPRRLPHVELTQVVGLHLINTHISEQEIQFSCIGRVGT